MARPRDPKVDAAALAAARSILAEDGFAGLTIEGVAQRAGVSRPSVYRRWSSKTDLAMAAVSGLATIGRGSPAGSPAQAPDTGSLSSDLRELTDRLVRGFASMDRYGVMGGIAAEMATDPAFAKRLRQTLLDPDQRALAGVFDRAVERGELAGPVDGTALLEMLAGIVFYRQVVLHRPCPPAWRAAVARAVTAAAVAEAEA